MKSLLFTSALVALGGVLAMAGSVQAELKVGDEAPAFELTGSDGKVYKSSDFKGKQVVVIAWYPKAFTGGCTKECKSLKEHGADLKKLDVSYFTASCDTVQLNTDFAKSLMLDYPILSDPDKKVATAFGVVDATRPNPQRWTFYIGKDGKIAHIEKSVKTETHGKDIAAKLREMGVGERK